MMAQREIANWVTINGRHVPIYYEDVPEEQMQKELDEHFEKVDSMLKKFEDGKLGTFIEDSKEAKELGIDSHIERLSKKEFVDMYVKEPNNNLRATGDLFSYWDEDSMIHIRYNDGKILTISPQWWESDKKIPTVGIDSAIISSGWGDAFCGKNVRLYNSREETGYGKYGYKDLKQRYRDEDDIRLDFY